MRLPCPNNASKTKLKTIQKQGLTAKQTLVRSNLKLCNSIAHRHFHNRELETLDLIQEGIFGLQRAAEKFDPSRGCKFSTYAYPWIKESMNRALQKKSRTIRLPIHLLVKIAKTRKCSETLTKTLNRQPSLNEISSASGLKIKDLNQAFRLQHFTKSLDATIDCSEALTLLDSIECPLLIPIERLANAEERLSIREAFYSCSGEEQEAIFLRLGLDGNGRRTYAQISNEMGKSIYKTKLLFAEGIAQIKSKLSYLEESLQI